MKIFLWLGVWFVSSLGFADDSIPLLRSPNSSTKTEVTPPMAPPGKKQEKDLVLSDVLGPGPDPNQPYVADVDVFGTSQINATTLKEVLGTDLPLYIVKGLKNDPMSTEIERRMAEKLKQRYGFAVVECSVIQYFEPGNLAVYITWDVVEPADVSRRMPFESPRTAEFKDPDGLIRHWIDYENIGLKLIASGAIDSEGTPCPALHCPFGHKHEQLRKYEKIFVEGVTKNEKALAEILSKDRRAEFRAAAAYLIPYLKDGKKVVTYLVDRIKDREDIVRNNALRVLGDIAEGHPEYVIPLHPAIEALHFPRVTDRSKAAYLIYSLVTNSKDAKEEVLKTAVPDLLKMLESKQPDHKELSHSILRKTSGKDYAMTDVRSWNRWYTKFQTENRGVSSQKK